mmetsp:Transcript_2691/g.8929  ORF Transcript_2691/g.8929 Transcript_2691/m.8929 type:complete len:317 (-) Transcript_2691:3-953(-)
MEFKFFTALGVTSPGLASSKLLSNNAREVSKSPLYTAATAAFTIVVASCDLASNASNVSLASRNRAPASKYSPRSRDTSNFCASLAADPSANVNVSADSKHNRAPSKSPIIKCARPAAERYDGSLGALRASASNHANAARASPLRIIRLAIANATARDRRRHSSTTTSSFARSRTISIHNAYNAPSASSPATPPSAAHSARSASAANGSASRPHASSNALENNISRASLVRPLASIAPARRVARPIAPSSSSSPPPNESITHARRVAIRPRPDASSSPPRSRDRATASRNVSSPPTPRASRVVHPSMPSASRTPDA